MLVPIDFLSCSGSLEKLAVGQFFMGAWAAEKINRNSARLQKSGFFKWLQTSAGILQDFFEKFEKETFQNIIEKKIVYICIVHI